MNRNLTPKIIIFLVFLLITSAIYWIALNFADNKFNDLTTKVLTSIKSNKASDDVVLVVVDDKSLDKISWPWGRNLFSDIFDYLEKDCGAKAVIFQNLVVSPDTYSPENDKIFYEHLRNENKLINIYILLNSNVTGDILPLEYVKLFDKKSNVTIIDKRTYKPMSSYKGIFKFPKEFLINAKILASSVISEDNDEIVRNYMPVVFFADKIYPSVALSAYALYTGQNTFVLYDDYLCSNDDCKTLKMPLVTKKGRDYIGNTLEGSFSYLKWYKPLNDSYTHKAYSAIDVLVSAYDFKSGKVLKINKDKFKDKIVIVGLNADKRVWEQLSETPILKRQADVDVHATMINNMLENKFISVNKNDNSSLWITILFSLFIIKGFKKFKENLIFTTILALIYFIYYIYEYLHLISVSSITPIITFYTVLILKKIYNLVTTDMTSEMIKHAMGKYVSNDVMKKIISNLDKLKLGGIRTTVTILFVDIRNFTQMSEKLPPQEVSSVLNEYFSVVEPLIAKYSGIVNKYMGDGLLAIFGEPIQNEQHALNAIKCGVEIIENVKILKEKLLSEGKPKIDVGIGINTGEVFAGNIGTEERFEYTVIGDNVNLANRIESYNHLLKTQFLISENTYELVKDSVEVVRLSQVKIKGKSKPIDIYEVLRINDNE
jgi:adenylate cyclase